MKYKIVKIEKLSGTEASIYTLLQDGETKTLFDSFLSENNNLFKSEIIDIVKRLRAIGQKTGAREQFFKLNEGNPGDGVSALYDRRNAILRLYCIRYANIAIILGSGGEKPKSIKSFQDSPKLKKENYLLRRASKEILERIKNKDFKWSPDSSDLIGNLEIEIDEE